MDEVQFPTRHTDNAMIGGQLGRPSVEGRRPAIVAMHGCGGLFTSKGRMSSRHRDWAERFVAAGYVVLLPDSFGLRGLGPQCKIRDRDIRPRGRVGDAVGAADWLAAQPYVDPVRIALLGWSNGGSAVLWAVSGDVRPAANDWRVAIAFYPGCRTPSKNVDWTPRVVPHVLIGAADDWTPPAPCRVLKERGAIQLIEYPGAYHGFDAPSSPVRVREGLAFTADDDGTAHVGTDPKARAAAIDDVTRILAEAFK
jgi:dienelactone hydrolase